MQRKISFTTSDMKSMAQKTCNHAEIVKETFEFIQKIEYERKQHTINLTIHFF